MAYTFDPIFAADPNNPSNVAVNASVTIFDPADATMAPISITDVTGLGLSNPLTVNSHGFGPAFQASIDRVGWFGGGFMGYLTSYEGMKQVAIDAQTAAQNALMTNASVDATGILTITKAGGDTIDVGNVKGQKGDKGADGANGSNVLPTDTAIADAINGSDTQSVLALRNAFGLSNSDGAQTAVLFGDSIVAQCEDETISAANGYYSRFSWTNWANFFLGYRLKVVKNAGIGGNETGQMLARIDADVKPYASDWVIMDGGVNDIFDGNGVPLATTMSNLDAIFQRITKVYGRKVMMMLPTGSGYGNSTTFANLYRLHRWLKTYAREHRGIYLFDGHGWYCDPSDGMPILGYVRPEDSPTAQSRGVHPGYIGAAKIGRALADALEPHFSKADGLTTSTNADTTNLLSNGRMTGNNYGIATGWALQGAQGQAVSGATPTKIPRPDGKPGEAQQVVVTSGGTGARLFNQNTDTTTWATGDRVYAEVEFETDPDTSGSYGFSVSLQFWNGLGQVSSIISASNDNPAAGIDVYPRSGIIRTPAGPVPSGTGRLQLFINLPLGTTRILSVNVRKVDY